MNNCEVVKMWGKAKPPAETKARKIGVCATIDYMVQTFAETEMVNMAEIEPPIALGALDGRYRGVVAPLTNYFSEAGLNRARIFVEVEWLIYLLDNAVLPGAPKLSDAERTYLRDLVKNFNADTIAELAKTEAVTRHDVKAVEYYIKDRLDAAPEVLGETVLPDLHEVVHIFCTSEDINNLSYALVIQAGVKNVWLPAARQLRQDLQDRAVENRDVPMLSRTHGQPATPSTMGKELGVFAYRLGRQIQRIENTAYLGKLNGATGTLGAHIVAVPEADWLGISKGFVEHLGLTWNPVTTQIESHDWQAELYSDIARFNRIAHNFATDAWTYISLDYFHQNLAAQGSTGSSTMPHKVNPIRFENAEANLEISCALLDTLAATLVTSRMQRDLTDSTTQRNIGTGIGHSLLALDNLMRGLAGIDINAEKMAADLDQNWEVLGEAVQQAMRAASIAGATGMEDPYERLKELTRGHRVTGEEMREFIAGLNLPNDVEERLLELTPASYIGVASKIVDFAVEANAEEDL